MRLNFAFKIFIIFAVFALLSFFLPVINLNGIDPLLTSATFLFSVLYGFEISVVINNFSQLKTQVATENAGLLSIFHLAQIIGGEAAKEIEEKIENYLLAAIDYPLAEHLKTDKVFFGIFKPLLKLSNAGGDQKGQALQYMNEGLYYIPQARNQIAEVAPKFVGSSVWIMLITLSVVLLGIMFIGRDPDFFSKLTVAVFSTTVVGALFLLDEIDSNRIEEEHLEYGAFNETLASMDKLPYYPDFAVKKGIVKLPKKGSFRIGHFPNYPSLEERKIELVEKS
jgi:hypothetical protein